MLIALRAILLVLFIAAPFGERRIEADVRPVGDYAPDAALGCPVSPGAPLKVDTWDAAPEGKAARPDGPGENA
ncbi:MAG TPA: hypothetical protein VFG91_07575 [Woeseiaceae bacterium]|nr:hypothetical protein [Woeseiaceae bacterium]